ncbi:hypothetical protein HN766_20320 [Candidatus Poribacteria bacterium]|nr:hypothetical protein [Candidatus Poribacteria bacterium]
MSGLREAAMDPHEAIRLLDAAHQVADDYRTNLNSLAGSQVSYTQPLDLAYKGSKRAGTIGMAHHLAHSNFAVDRMGGGGGELTPTMEGLRRAFGRRGVWAALFNMTQHQAIGEQSYTKTAFAEKLAGGMHLHPGIGKATRISQYGPSFALISPTRMRGSFARYLEKVDAIEEQIGDDTIQDEIARFLSGLSMPSLITAEESRLLCRGMGYEYAPCPEVMATTDGLVQRDPDRCWMTYFNEKAKAIVAEGLHAAVIGHLFCQIHRVTNEATGVLFAIIDVLGESEKLEDLFFAMRDREETLV